MKLSSISLIAAALATAAVCAIAVPRPCALEQINSFQSDPVVHRREAEVFALERNVEPVDNLVTRGGVSNADAARIVRWSASLHRQAAIMAGEAGKKAEKAAMGEGTSSTYGRHQSVIQIVLPIESNTRDIRSKTYGTSSGEHCEEKLSSTGDSDPRP